MSCRACIGVRDSRRRSSPASEGCVDATAQDLGKPVTGEKCASRRGGREPDIAAAGTCCRCMSGAYGLGTRNSLRVPERIESTVPIVMVLLGAWRERGMAAENRYRQRSASRRMGGGLREIPKPRCSTHFGRCSAGARIRRLIGNGGVRFTSLPKGRPSLCVRTGRPHSAPDHMAHKASHVRASGSREEVARRRARGTGDRRAPGSCQGRPSQAGWAIAVRRKLFKVPSQPCPSAMRHRCSRAGGLRLDQPASMPLATATGEPRLVVAEITGR